MNLANKKDWKFSLKKVNRDDITDLPFTIHGIQLRWLANRKNENRHMAGQWKTLKKSDLPKDLVASLEESYIGIFGDGDTIRNGDLVLGYASIDHARELKKEMAENAKNQAEKVFRKPTESTPNNALSIDRAETGIGNVGEEFFNK